MRTNRHQVRRSDGTEDSVIEVVALQESAEIRGRRGPMAANSLFTSGGLRIKRLRKGVYEIEATREVLTSDAMDAP